MIDRYNIKGQRRVVDRYDIKQMTHILITNTLFTRVTVILVNSCTQAFRMAAVNTYHISNYGYVLESFT